MPPAFVCRLSHGRTKIADFNLPLTIHHTSAVFRQNGRLSLVEPPPASAAIFVNEAIRI
jgi:hypothetical protein